MIACEPAHTTVHKFKPVEHTDSYFSHRIWQKSPLTVIIFLLFYHDGVKEQLIAACLFNLRPNILTTNHILHMADELQTKSLQPYAALSSQVVTLVT